MLVAITYGDEKYSMSKKVNVLSAYLLGHARKVKCYSPKDIDSEFFDKHREILMETRGGGYWLWKPYLILKTLDEINFGDYLMYSDAGTVYVRSIKYLIREMQRYKQDIFASSSCYIERQWSKRDAFEIIGCNYEEYQNAFQCEATFVLIKKTAFSIEFVKEWLMYCCDRRIVTDDENVLGKPNAVDFISNRHDQTAFSLLCKKHNIKAFRGISDSSELYKFLQYKDGDFFGMTRQQLIENALRHRASDEYARGSYKRIIVNTRLQNTTKWLFCKRLVKKIIINLRTDMRKKSIEGVFLDIKIL